jgi:hypothetical protein
MWDLYRYGYDQRDFRLLFPGVLVEELRRAIVEAAASAKHSVPPNHMLTFERCGALTCVECVTLEWLQG